MDLKQIRDEIFESLSPEQVQDKIVSDLGLVEKNKKYICHMHNDKNPSMSFWSEGKLFRCFACGGTYNILDHYMQHKSLSFVEALHEIVKDFGLTNIELEKPRQQHKPKEKPEEHEAINEQVMQYVALRGISQKTVDYVGLKANKSNVVFEYRDENGKHLSNKYRPARKLGKDELKTWFQAKTNCNTLYNMQKIDVGQALVICEGEFDCLSLIEAGYKNAVSVPTGAESEEWIDSCWEWLVQFKEIILWFDNDKAGKKGVRKVSARLPNELVKVVHSEKGKDINEILHRQGPKVVLSELANAKEVDIVGVAKMSQVADFDVYEAEKIRTGIPILDKYIWGFVMGTLDIITGYNGSGKSTLINQMCIAEAIAQGYKTFVFSGELTLSNFKYWLYSTVANAADLVKCTSKDGKEYHKLSEVAKMNITDWIDDKLFVYDQDDYSEKAILAMMELLAKRKGVKCFVIDNLMKVELDENQKNDLIAQKKFVNKLKAFSVKYDAVVHLVAHPRKPSEGQHLTKYDVAGSGDITNLADYVIGVHRTTENEKKQYEESIEKNSPIQNPKDASIMLFKDRPTGSGDKEAKMFFAPGRKRFYLNDAQLDRNYGYLATPEQQKIDEDFPF